MTDIIVKDPTLDRRVREISPEELERRKERKRQAKEDKQRALLGSDVHRRLKEIDAEQSRLENRIRQLKNERRKLLYSKNPNPRKSK